MPVLYEILEKVSRADFVKVLERQESWVEEQSQRPRDGQARDLIEKHEVDSGQKYYLVQLNEEGVRRLILPDHVSVVHYGDSFECTISKYTSSNFKYPNCCKKRIPSIRNLIDDTLFSQIGKHFPKAALPFVSNDSHFGVQMGSPVSGGGPFLYTGCFHRFVTYGVWWDERRKGGHPYIPLELYFCKLPSNP
ncbi:hypothetical protein ACFLYO_06970 [Chloroflexota bacterium]